MLLFPEVWRELDFVFEAATVSLPSGEKQLLVHCHPAPVRIHTKYECLNERQNK